MLMETPPGRFYLRESSSLCTVKAQRWMADVRQNNSPGDGDARSWYRVLQRSSANRVNTVFILGKKHTPPTNAAHHTTQHIPLCILNAVASSPGYQGWHHLSGTGSHRTG